MFAVAEAAAAAGGINFKLKEGFSAETSGFNVLVMNVLYSLPTHTGGLLVCLSKETAQDFCDELKVVKCKVVGVCM